MLEFPSVKRPEGDIEPQEVILDKLVQESETGGLSERKLEIPLQKSVLYFLYAAFVLIFVLFFIKSFQLQIFSHGYWNALAKKNVAREIPLAAPRGVIYDKNFVQLTFNQPSFDFVCDKRDMPFLKSSLLQVIEKISSTLGVDSYDIIQQLNDTTDPQILIKPDLSHDELILLKARGEDFQGCEIQENARREYPNGQVFSQVVGYTAKISRDEKVSAPGYSASDQIGKSGIEKTYESILRGTPGTRVVQKDASGKTVGEKEQTSSVQGSSLVLWLDSGLQKKLTQSLEEVFSQIGAKKAAGVALDPYTGAVLALVSLPSFNNNMFSQGLSAKDWQTFLANPLKPLFNRAISGLGFPTGSVIKPLMGAAALQEGIINERTTIFAPSELCVPNKFTGLEDCFHDWTFHGYSDIKRAIAESVNPFFYIIGGGHDNFAGLGAQRIKKYLELFGWSKKTGIDLPAEGQGILPTIDNNWRLGDTYHFSIGQGPFAVTPLQVASAIGAIANGGKLMQPMVVQKIVDGSKNVIEQKQPRVLRENFIDSKNLEIIKQGMRQTVTAGSATGWLDRLGVPAGAKTGTAQTGRKTPEGKDYLYSWTVAFAPYDHPQIVLVAVVENIREGQVASLPVARDTLQWYFNK